MDGGYIMLSEIGQKRKIPHEFIYMYNIINKINKQNTEP